MPTASDCRGTHQRVPATRATQERQRYSAHTQRSRTTLSSVNYHVLCRGGTTPVILPKSRLRSSSGPRKSAGLKTGSSALAFMGRISCILRSTLRLIRNHKESSEDNKKAITRASFHSHERRTPCARRVPSRVPRDCALSADCTILPFCRGLATGCSHRVYVQHVCSFVRHSRSAHRSITLL